MKEVNMDRKKLKELRCFLKDEIRQDVDSDDTDQNRGLPMPPVQKPVPEGGTVVRLPEWRGAVKPEGSLDQLIENRRSVRKFGEEGLTAGELSYLFWATQGVRKVKGERVMRTVPSAGNRHATECYAALTRDVKGDGGETVFQAGLWRYLPLSHALLYMGCPENLPDKISEASLGQEFVGSAPIVFFWACIPYRMEWRYAEASHKVIAIDAGHICQNLYLAAGSLGCGTCAVAAYSQGKADALLQLDGEEEFVVYMAPVGRIPPREQ
jgi:SagB-type dehydrogenase family enzyme